jgi:hypothetical protein
MDSVLPKLFFWGLRIWQNRDCILPPAERGLGNECGRVRRRAGNSEVQELINTFMTKPATLNIHLPDFALDFGIVI